MSQPTLSGGYSYCFLRMFPQQTEIMGHVIETPVSQPREVKSFTALRPLSLNNSFATLVLPLKMILTKLTLQHHYRIVCPGCHYVY